MPKRNAKSQSKLALPPKKRPTHFATLKKIAKSRSVQAEWYYRLGVELNKLAPQNGASVGEMLRLVAQRVFKNDRMVPTLYSARQFAAKFSRAELKNLKQLPWGYVHYLLTLQRKRSLNSLITRAQEDGMTVRRFRLLVQDTNGGPGRGGKGRRRKPPVVGPQSALRELQRICHEWEFLAGHYLQLASTSMSSKRAKQTDDEQSLQAAVRALEQVTKAAQQAARLLNKSATP